MKTLILILSIFLPSFIYSQTDAIDDFYDSHRFGEDNIKIKLGNSLLTIGSWFIEEPATRALVRKSNRARILISDEKPVSRREINYLINDIKRDGYESLALVRDGLDKVEVYMREDRKYIRNLLVIVEADESFVLASLDCRLTLDDIEAALDEEL
ncbi:MAG: DUF4252 domain-containing protein [Saprospiraceae bacterium]|nr:DUF4252 domain-containing protein [Saprospiraceae bacterium]